MGSFFLVIFFILLIIVSFVILIIAGITKKPGAGYVLLILWGSIILLGISSYVGKLIKDKKVLDKNDFYGNYIIDRNYFSGKQADWQYNHFRFEIKENDSLFFYITDGQKIDKTYKGKISTLEQYQSARLIIKMEDYNHHILTTNPTIYRESWGFFMVFNSPKFNNMYFRKGKWENVE